MSYDLLGTFAAGLLTFLSPCILPLAPVYLGLLGGASLGELRAGTRVGRTVLATLAFSLGLGLVFVALGMAATAVGHALVAHRSLFLQLGGLVVFLMGLKYLGALNLPWLERDLRPGLERVRGGGPLGALLMGAAFGLGWTPCIGPVLGSVLTFTATSTSRPLDGALYLATYSAGLSLPLFAASMIAPLALKWLRGAQRWVRPLQRVTGGLLCAVGLLLLTDKLGVLQPTWGSSPEQSSAAESSQTPESLDARASPERPSLGPAQGCEAGLSNSTTCALEEGAKTADKVDPLELNGPVMVELVGRTCPICLRMAPVVKAVERECAGRKVQIRRIEVDDPQGRELARRFGVLGVPTFLFLDAAGKEIARLVGEQPLASLRQSLQVLTGEECAGFRSLAAPPARLAPPPASGTSRTL